MADPDNWSYVSREGAPNGVLYPWGPNATYDARTDRFGLPDEPTLDKFASIYESALGSAAPVGGREAVLMAGPPGAGKSTARSTVTARLGWAEGSYLHIDPDELKKQLLESDIMAGSYFALLPNEVRDLIASGRVFQPMEMIGLWHEESLLLTDFFIQRAAADGLNILIDGTLGNRLTADRRIDDLRSAGYTSILIADVEVNRKESLERIRHRYDIERATEPLGGRIVPTATIDAHFSGPGGISLSLLNSSDLAASGAADLELIGLRRDVTGTAPQMVFSTLDGDRGSAYVPTQPSPDHVWVTGHVRAGGYVRDYWRSKAEH